MKEAITVGPDGSFQDVTLVPDDWHGVYALWDTPEPTEAEPNPSPVITGYHVAVKCPQGFFQPKYDLQTGKWVEGMPQTQIDAIKNAPKPKTQMDIIGEQLTQNRLSSFKTNSNQSDMGKQLVSQRLANLQSMSNTNTLGRILVRMRLQQIKP